LQAWLEAYSSIRTSNHNRIHVRLPMSSSTTLPARSHIAVFLCNAFTVLFPLRHHCVVTTSSSAAYHVALLHFLPAPSEGYFCNSETWRAISANQIIRKLRGPFLEFSLEEILDVRKDLFQKVRANGSEAATVIREKTHPKKLKWH
jgi:hypothetical protein